jgi:uncharacterized membrane protein (DUF4010 family)
MVFTTELASKIAYALGIGILIGLERSLKHAPTLSPEQEDDALADTPEHTREQFLGIRTYSVLSLSGFAAAMVGASNPLAAAIVLAGLMGLIVVLYIRTPEWDPGITTEAAAVCCCCLGMLCYHHPHAAGVLGVLITIVLALKGYTVTALARLRRVELTDTLKFLVIIFILLPLLPNRPLDPWSVFNPYKVVLLVVLISGISFVGYFLTKFLGAQRGLGLTGLLGGLTSSTAVTAAMATQAKAEPQIQGPCTFATIIANATMFARVLVVVGLLDRALLRSLAPSIGAMLLMAAAATVVLWIITRRRATGKEEQSGELELSNPFSLGPALKFAAFFVVILLVAKVAKDQLGNQGLYLASLASGLADVDAITLSVTEQAKSGDLLRSVAAMAITIAVVSNSVVKSGIAIYSGGWEYGRLVGAILMVATGTGLAVLLVF